MFFDDRKSAQRELKKLGFRALEPFLTPNLRETIVFQEFGEAPVEAAGLTKFGGPPDVPAGFQWPRVRLHADFLDYSPDFPRFGESAPLPFVGQFDLGRLGVHLGPHWPRRGMLWLFGLNVLPRFELAGTNRAGYRWLYEESPAELRPLNGSQEQKEFEAFAAQHLGEITGYGLEGGMYLTTMRPCVQMMPIQNPLAEWSLSATWRDLLKRGDSLRSVLQTRGGDKQLFAEIERWSKISDSEPECDDDDDDDEETEDGEYLTRMGGYPGDGFTYIRPGKNYDRSSFDSEVFRLVLDAKHTSSPDIRERLDTLIARDRANLADGVGYAVDNELLLQLPSHQVQLTAWTPHNEMRSGTFDTARVWSNYPM